MRIISRVLIALTLNSIVMFTGCMTNKIVGMEIKPNLVLPEKYSMAVPHISQNDNYSCATTSVAMALSSYQSLFIRPLDKEESWIISKSNKFQIRTFGNDARALIRLIQYYGFSGEAVNHIGIYNLKYLLSKGILVVLFIRPNPNKFETHAVLAIGYSDSEQKIFIEDPSNYFSDFSYKDINYYWNAFLSNPIGMTEQAGLIIYPEKLK